MATGSYPKRGTMRGRVDWRSKLMDPIKFTPSHYQEAIFDDATNGSGNVIIEAVAGSGKSTSLKIAYKLLDAVRGSPTLILAFNFNIANETKEAGLNAKTLNGLGYAATMANKQRFGGAALYLDTHGAKLDEAMAACVPKAWLPKVGPQVKRMVSIARGTAAGTAVCVKRGLTPLVQTSPDFWNDIIDRFDIEFELEYEKDGTFKGFEEMAALSARFAEEVLHTCNTRLDVIDFDDQKAFPVLYNLPMRPYWNLLVDEAQDLNRLDRELVRRSMKRGTRVIFCGDTFQAIYGWRGADTQSMAMIKEEFNCKVLPLSICYRCPTSHVEMAQEFVPHLEARPGAPEGDIHYPEKYGASFFRPNDIVVCRNNAPIVTLAFRLIKSRVVVKVLGRDFLSGLLSMLRKAKETFANLGKPGENEITFLIEYLKALQAQQIAKAESTNKKSKVEAIQDKFSAIFGIIEEGDATTIDATISDMERVFGTENEKLPAVTLSSIHRMKGGEGDRIHFLDEYLVPSRNAVGDAYQQEKNLKYVALTRSKGYLSFIRSDAWEGAK